MVCGKIHTDLLASVCQPGGSSVSRCCWSHVGQTDRRWPFTIDSALRVNMASRLKAYVGSGFSIKETLNSPDTIYLCSSITEGVAVKTLYITITIVAAAGNLQSI